MNNRYINSVCFIRKYGWKNGEELYDMRLDCLKNHIEMNNKSDFKATYLYEYDALVDKRFTDLGKTMFKSDDEVGLWLEIVKELAEEAGIEWRGREGWSWDYFVNPGFIMAYTSEEKKKLIDCAMEKVKSHFGNYPKTVGSWLIDTESMEYMSEKYDTDAFIICREQWGMDGYTLWGGPYYGGYYPSKNNMLTPAQSIENQINTPVFRMFVNDPIYCYYEYAEEKYNDIKYGLFTQEPAWMCGQNPNWIKWQYDNIFDSKCNDFQYIQVGQENTFKWYEKVGKPLAMQHEFIKENNDTYKYENITVSEMGKRFKKRYKTTPKRSVGALTDWAEKDNKAVWFNNENYRINIFSDKNEVWIRDIHIFCDEYRDEYIDNPCVERCALYDNPPIVDGIRMSDNDVKAGMFFGNGRIVSYSDSTDCFRVVITVNDKLVNINMYSNYIELKSEEDFIIEYRMKNDCDFIADYTEKKICYKHKNVRYTLEIENGLYQNGKLISENKELRLFLKK